MFKDKIRLAMAVSVDRFKYTFIGALPPSLGLNQLKTIITVSLCCLLLIVVLSGGGGWNAGRGETTPLEPEVGIEWKSLIHRNGSNVDVFEEMSIVSPDGSANATFIGELNASSVGGLLERLIA